MHIVLVHPEIPQNTGNIARTCAALGADLHLIRPLGFSVDERSVRRAGLDYWSFLSVHEYCSYEQFITSCEPHDLVLFTSRADRAYTDHEYSTDVYLVFGSETSGLPEELLHAHRGPVARIPTLAHIRCLNLSNSVAIAAYEVARQHGFPGLETTRATDSGSRSSKG